MSDDDGKKWGNLSVSDGGQATTRRVSAEAELERALRALFVAMCGKDGKAINKNFRNIARGHVRPLRVVIRRFKEAKQARAPQVYEKQKGVVRAFDRWVDQLHGKELTTTGEFTPPDAPATQKRAA